YPYIVYYHAFIMLCTPHVPHIPFSCVPPFSSLPPPYPFHSLLCRLFVRLSIPSYPSRGLPTRPPAPPTVFRLLLCPSRPLCPFIALILSLLLSFLFLLLTPPPLPPLPLPPRSIFFKGLVPVIYMGLPMV